MNSEQVRNGIAERLRIQEKALSNLADFVKKHEVETADEIGELKAEVKALKLFLARNVPVFKEQFPGIKQKVK